MKGHRLIVTLPQILKEAIAQEAKNKGCSHAEVIRASLYQTLQPSLKQPLSEKKQMTLAEAFVSALKKEEKKDGFSFKVV